MEKPLFQYLLHRIKWSQLVLLAQLLEHETNTVPGVPGKDIEPGTNIRDLQWEKELVQKEMTIADIQHRIGEWSRSESVYSIDFSNLFWRKWFTTNVVFSRVTVTWMVLLESASISFNMKLIEISSRCHRRTTGMQPLTPRLNASKIQPTENNGTATTATDAHSSIGRMHLFDFKGANQC
jgi:hypothetical protein